MILDIEGGGSSYIGSGTADRPFSVHWNSDRFEILVPAVTVGTGSDNVANGTRFYDYVPPVRYHVEDVQPERERIRRIDRDALPD